MAGDSAWDRRIEPFNELGVPGMNPHKPRGDGIAVSGIGWALRKSRVAATL
jgi:hypothetical protein